MWNSIRKNWEWWLFGVVAVVLAVGVIRWVWLGQVNGGETNSATIRNVGLIPLSLVAFILTWKRIKVAQRQAEASEGNLQTAQDALRHTEQEHEADRLHNRYADASQRLSSGSVSARLGAIYELQDLTAQNPELLHIRSMKLLCAFVRFPPPEARLDEVPDDDPCGLRLRPDVQAAMEVIGSRTAERIQLEADADYRPDLRGAHLVRLELRNGNLSGFDMRDGRFWGANLVGADLSGCMLQDADFSSPWVLRGVEIEELLAQSDGFFEASDALQSNMTYMMRVNLSGTLMLSAKLTGANLQGADMSEANLPDVDLSETTLVGVDFSNSELAEADMSNASLSSAKLNGTKMYHLNLSGTDLTGSKGENATHSQPPTGLTQIQLDQARADPDNPPKLDESSGLIWNPRSGPT
ncbi:pentapeptide repeat-containing protein [Candidatus Poriferisodalis sp.]|uniref:pentapeptide repeat-containing protein n=1 Tax=Candidatus Poriferisodalis sp. TaxID=3101277 RepID=UPI003B5220B8